MKRIVLLVTMGLLFSQSSFASWGKQTYEITIVNKIPYMIYINNFDVNSTCKDGKCRQHKENELPPFLNGGSDQQQSTSAQIRYSYLKSNRKSNLVFSVTISYVDPKSGKNKYCIALGNVKRFYKASRASYHTHYTWKFKSTAHAPLCKLSRSDKHFTLTVG